MARNILYILFLFLVLSINSCAHQNKASKQNAVVKNSIMKMETWLSLIRCNEEAQSCEDGANLNQLYSTGTGSVVMYKGKKVLLTAAHVCDLTEIRSVAPANGQANLYAIDQDGRKTLTSVIKLNSKLDICLLRMHEEIEYDAIPISMKRPEYSEKVYYLGGPLGVLEEDIVPVFSGHFFGTDHIHAFYSLPVIGGASGSPIVNSQGHLIGMVHSVHYRFHHISLSVRYNDLWNFLKN